MNLPVFLRGVSAAALLFLACSIVAAEPFPFDQDFLLDAAPMRPGKRMPGINVEPNGSARIDLWCRTVAARIEISDAGIKVEAGSLPENPPEMQSAAQCTPERMQADEELFASLAQVTAWRREGESIVLEGPKPLRFRLSSH
jgi:hypothetical protein